VGGYKICEVEYQVGEWNAGGGVVKVVGCCVRCGRFVRVARANEGLVPRIQGALRQCQRVDLSVRLRAREKYWKLLEPRSLPMVVLGKGLDWKKWMDIVADLIDRRKKVRMFCIEK
jgi:hypothetical protein